MKKNNSLDEQTLKIVNNRVQEYGLDNTLDKVYSLLQEAKLRKEYAKKRNIPLYNTDLHIQGLSDIIDYLTEKLIERNITKILVGK